ncbi:hypothetical protein D3C86_1075760 [compost metagenome]
MGIHRVIAAISLVALVGCTASHPVANPPEGSGVNVSQQRASLHVSLRGFAPKLVVDGGLSTQALNVRAIASAQVTLSGSGIAEPLSMSVPVDEGIASVTFRDIPQGPNRIITAVGLDADGQPVPGAVIRSVVTIGHGSNEASVGWPSTPMGTVYHALLNDDRSQGTDLATTVSAEAVGALVSAVTSQFAVPHPSLIKALEIARQIRLANGDVPPAYSGLVINAASVTLDVMGLPAGRTIRAFVTDPASEVKADLGNGQVSLDRVLPGTWDLHVESADFGSQRASVTFNEGQTARASIDYTNSAGVGIDFTGGGNPLPPVTGPGTGSGLYNLIIEYDR